MEESDIIDSEGGGIIFGDASLLQNWRVPIDESPECRQIESMFERGISGITMLISGESIALWDEGGPGTVDVFDRTDCSQIVLVRAWIEDTDKAGNIPVFGEMPISVTSSRKIGQIKIHSGYMAIFSVYESGECINRLDTGRYSVSMLNMSSQSSGVILPVPLGTYDLISDEVNLDSEEAVRCHIIKI